MAIALAVKVFFGKDTFEYVILDEAEPTEADFLYRKVNLLLSAGRICEAEDLIFDCAESGDTDVLRVALDFYAKLNEKGDEALEAGNFSRGEISDGLEDIIKLYGIVGL